MDVTLILQTEIPKLKSLTSQLVFLKDRQKSEVVVKKAS